MAFDFKKEYKKLYAPKDIGIVNIPKINYLAVRGAGNPNDDTVTSKNAIRKSKR